MAGLSTGAPIVKVYHAKSMILPDVSRVLACLYEKDIRFETHTASSYKSLLRLQASSHAPVPFYDGPTFLEESREICRYIAETYEHHGYPFLLGKDSLERASIEQWLHHEEHTFNPPSRSLFCHLAFPLDEDDDDIDLQKRKLEEVLEVYEQRLSDSEFLAGNKFTLADLVHLPNSHYITESDKFVYLYDSRKNVQRWWHAISTRDSWQKVLKDIKKVEQQHKEEELKKQQQQWQREHPTTTRHQIRSRKHTSTKSQTILVPPPSGIISTSPTAPQTEEPRPTETSPDETSVSSSLSTPTTHKSSAVQSKHVTISTTHRETPQASVRSTPRIPEKSPIFAPSTSPTTVEKPQSIYAGKPSTRDVSIPSEATEADLPTKSKPSSTKEVSNNIHVFDFYKASSHTDEAEPYIEPTPQINSEMLDKFSETDGSSGATIHAKTSPRSAKEDSDQLSASGFYKSDSTANSADREDKESARYSERTLRRPAETIYRRSTVQRATDASPGKLRSTEAHQTRQTEQWHAATAGLSNLKGETDHSMSTRQVKPSKDAQQYSSQASTEPLSQEPVSMDGQIVQGPEMSAGTPYTDQKSDVSSMLWRQAADVRGIAEEDEASSDHRGAVLPPYTRKHSEEARIVSADRRKDASLPKHVTDEAAQAVPFQTAYDDAHHTTQKARETASAPRRTRGQDGHDTSEGIATYHSASSRSQPMDAPQDASSPSKQTAYEGPRRATTPYPGAQEFIKQARESPASRPAVPHDAQGSTEEETLESSSSGAQLLDSRLAAAFPPKQSLDEDGYGAIPPRQTGHTDDLYNRQQDRDTAAPRRMMAQDTFEEKKIADPVSFKAQTFDYRQADTTPQMQPPAEDPRATTPFRKRYSGDEDATKQSKHAASRPKRTAQEVQDNFEETKVHDSLSSREQLSDSWRAPGPLPRHEVDDAPSTTVPFQKRYPDTLGNAKEVEDVTSMPWQMAGEDAQEIFEETKFSDSTSSQAQPLDYQRTDAPSRKQEAIEDPPGATSPFEKRYSHVEDTTKHSRDTAFKPREMLGQDAQDPSEEAEAHNSALFRVQPPDAPGQRQSPDAWRAPATPSKQAAAEDDLSVSQSSPTRYPRAEETSKLPRAAASRSLHVAAQDARDARAKVSDSRSSIGLPSDARAAAPLTKQEVPDARSTNAPFQTRYPDTKGTTKEAKGTLEETKIPDSASSQVQPLDSQRADAASRKKEATEDSPRATSPFKKGHSNAEKRSPSDEDIIKRPRGSASAPRRTTAQDANGTFQDSKPADSVPSREQPLSTWQPVVTPPRQEIEDSHSTTSAFRNYPYVEDSTSQAEDTAFLPRRIRAEDTTEETKVTDSASSSAKPTYIPRTALPLSEQAEAEEDAWDKGRESQSTSSKAKPIDPRSPIKVERTPSVYQEDPRIAQDSHEQAQTIPTGVRSDGPAPNYQQAPVPSTSEEISTPSAPPRENVDDHITEEPFKRDTVDDRKEALPLLGKEPTSQVQRATELLQEAAPDGDTSSKSSTIDQWRRVSVPLQDVTPKSGNDMLGVSTIDQQPIRMSQQANLSARGANEMIKRSVEQRFEPPAPTGAQTFDVQHAPPSLPGAATVERAGELVQTQAPTLDARPTSATTPTKRATPDAHDTGDQEFVSTSDGQRSKTSKAGHDSAIIHDDVSDASLSTHGATVHDKTTTSHASEAQGSGTWPDSTPTPLNIRRPASDDELARRYLRDQGAQPPELTQEQTLLKGPHDSVSTKDVPDDALARTKFAKPTSTEGISPTAGPASTLEAQLAAPLRAEVPYAEQKFAPSDDQTKTPQTIFRQQPKPPAPITREIPTSGTRHDTGKIQDITLDNLPTDDSTIPLVPSHQQVPHAPKTIPDKNDMTAAPGTRDSPASDTQLASAKVQEVIPDNYRTDELKMPFVSSEKQGSYAGPSTEPHEGPSPDARSAVVHKETTKSPSRQAPILEARPDSTSTDSYVRPTSGDEPGILPDRAAESPTAAQATYSKDLRSSASTQDIPANALGNFKKPGPRSTTQKAISSTPRQALDLVAQPDSAKDEVSPATKKFALSDQDSVHSAQQPSLAKPGKEDAIVAAAERTSPTVIGQQETQGMRVAPPSDTQHASSKIQEVDHDIDLDKSVPSQEKVSQDGRTSESRDGVTPYVHSSIVHDMATTVPASLTSISDAALDSTPTSSDVHPASGIEPGVEPPSGKQAPQFLKDLDSVPAEDIPADASGEAQSTRPSVSPDNQRGRPGEVAIAEQKPSPSGQDSAHSIQPPFSAEPSKEEIKDSARSAQPLFSPAPDQTKDSQTTIGQQDISPAPGTLKSPSSRTDYASGKLQEVAPDDHHIIESIPSQGQVSRAKHAFEPFEGPTRDVHTAIDEKTMRPPSSQAQSSDSKPDSTQNPSDELSARFLPNQVAQQHADTQAPPPLIGLYESKSIQDVPSDALGEAKSLKPPSIEQEATASEVTSAFTPDAHLASAPREVAPAGQKILLKDQDSPQSVQKPPSSDSTKEQSTVAAPDQAKASQKIFGQQDIAPSLTRTTDPSSDSLHASRKLQETPPVDCCIHGSIPRQEQVPHAGRVSEQREGPTPDTHGATVEENMTHTTGPTSGPHPQHDASGKVEPLKATGEVTPADQNIAPSEPLSAVESRKEDSSVAEAEQSEVPEPIIGQQDIGHTPGISEPVRDDDGNKESVSRKEQVSHNQRASEPREGSHPDVHGSFVDKKTTAPSSQAQSSDANRDSSPIHGDGDPRSGGQSTTRILPDQGAQQAASTKSPPPLEALQYSESTRHVPADALGKAKPLKPTSVDQEVMSPTALPNTQLDTAPGEVAPDAQNNALPGQDIARPAQLPFSAEPTKEEVVVAASDQTSGAQTIIGQQGITPATDKEKNPLSESYIDHASRKSQDDDGMDESVPSQEQVSLGEHASVPREGTTTDSHGANVDDKINTSSPVTSSLHNPQAQAPPRTQALPVDALGGPAFIQNVPADSLEKVESPRLPLTHQEVMAPMTGPAQAPDAPQGTTPGEAIPAEQKFTPLDQDSTTRLSPPVESRKQISNVAMADRTNVSQSSAPDTAPSEAALRELTKSAKSLLPTTGADPVQPPHEASFNLSSDEKTTMIKGDQANTVSNVNLSANQAVGQSESSAVKRALSEELVASFSQENPKGTSTEEISKQQQQTDTRSSEDDSTEANGIISPNVLTTSGDIQPSPPKESMEASEESRNQQHADEAVFKSTQDNEKQVEETKAQDTGRDNHEKMNLDANKNQKNNVTSQGEALEQPGEHVPGIQPQSKKTDSGSKSTKDRPSGIQTDNISESSLRTSEESKQQVQTEGRTQGGEANAPGSKTEQPKETDLPGSNKSITSPSQAEASDKSEEQTSSSIQNGDNNSSKLDGSTNDTKSDGMDDNPSS